MNALLQVAKSLGPARLIAVAVVGLLSLAFFGFIMGKVGGEDMALLYSDLSLEESSQIVARLDSQGVPYELRGDGTQIFVPRERALRLRMSMAEEGLPSGGSVGYEIFDQSDGFGTSSFVNNVNKVRALEGELARTIRSMTTVSAARVHLVLPQRELFSRDRPEPSASIFLKTHGGAQLTGSQVLAIQHVVAAAVSGLEANQISVVDDRGNLLARGAGDEQGLDLSLARAAQVEAGKEAYFASQIEEMLERTVGAGRADVTVNLDMNFDRVTVNEEIYDPEGRVVRSAQLVEESSHSSDQEPEDVPVSVSSELPQAEELEPGVSQSTNNKERIEETTNYEISRTNRVKVEEAGGIERISVAVLVDGTYTTDAEGNRTYAERSPEEIEQITALVRSAIGFNEERGDVVSVVNMPFAQPELGPTADEESPLLELRNDDYMRIAEIAVLAVLGILVLLLVLRPLVQRLFDPAVAAPRGGQQAQLGSSGAAPQLTGPDGEAGAQQPSADAMIDIDQVEGRVRASAIRKVGDLVEKHPDETVSIIRNWMYQQS